MHRKKDSERLPVGYCDGSWDTPPLPRVLPCVLVYQLGQNPAN